MEDVTNLIENIEKWHHLKIEDNFSLWSCPYDKRLAPEAQFNLVRYVLDVINREFGSEHPDWVTIKTTKGLRGTLKGGLASIKCGTINNPNGEEFVKISSTYGKEYYIINVQY